MQDSRRLRNALGKFATGVAVVTTVTGEREPVGLTINSFSSVSLDPPLILWSLTRHSPNLRHFTDSRWFGINVLSANQSHISQSFASRSDDRFSGIDWHFGDHDVPLLDGTLAQFECEVERITEGGDHVVFFGHVHSHKQEDREPLLFFSGQYGTASLAS